MLKDTSLIVLSLLLALAVTSPSVFAWNSKEPTHADHYTDSGNPGGGTVSARIWGGQDEEILLGGNGDSQNGQATVYAGFPGGGSDSVAGLFTATGGAIHGPYRAEIRVDRPASGTPSATMKSGAGAKIEAKGNGDVVITLP